MGKKILVLDFDGVCHSYTSGWKGAAVIPDPPVPGLFEFLAKAVEEFQVAIFSSRSHQEGGLQGMQDWFALKCPAEFTFVLDQLQFPLVKPPGWVGIDDRVITFIGTWPDIGYLANFKPWNKREQV
jgi:hypothetical protein